MYDEKCLLRVGCNVRALRLAVQMGQEELAEKLGVSQTHMSNMECGRVTTSIRGLLKLANIFDCSLDVLLDKKAAVKLAAQGPGRGTGSQSCTAKAGSGTCTKPQGKDHR